MITATADLLSDEAAKCYLVRFVHHAKRTGTSGVIMTDKCDQKENTNSTAFKFCLFGLNLFLYADVTTPLEIICIKVPFQ